MECTVCFEPILTLANGGITGVRCKRRTCTTAMCVPCVTEYLDVALSEKRVPKCPCGTFYLLSDLPPGLGPKYGQCCLADLVSQHGDTVRKKWEVQNVLVTLRQARLTFLTQRFPAAITYTAQVIMPHKLRALDKQIVDKAKETVISNKRVCMNLTCNGPLDENLTCMTCQTLFCGDCEKVKRPGVPHACNPDDVASVQAIRQFVKCPHCNLPIQRSMGCDFMTCANCNKHFNYQNGTATEYGNHGQNTEIRPQTTDGGRRLFSVVHADLVQELGLINQILRFEAAAPKVVDTTVLTNVLMLYYKNNQISTPEIELELARAFEKYMVSAHIQNRYQRAASELEGKLLNRTLSPGDIREMLYLLTQPL